MSGADQGCDRPGGDHRSQSVELLGSADERAAATGQVDDGLRHGGRGPPRSGEQRVVGQDAGVKLAELGPRLQAELGA